MIFRLTFQTNHLKLPMAYQTIVQGFVYHLLSTVPEYSAFLHDNGYTGSRQKHFKMFCFSRLQGKNRKYNKQIEFPYAVSLCLRTADPICSEILQHALVLHNEYQLCGQPIILKRIEQSELEIEEDCHQLKIQMISPMTVYTSTSDGKTHPYNPLDDKFPVLINENFQHKWESAVGSPAPGNIEIYALSVASRDKLVTKIKNIYVTAWGGTYLLKGSPDALKFLYHTGLGSKNSMGFGMFDIVK